MRVAKPGTAWVSLGLGSPSVHCDVALGFTRLRNCQCPKQVFRPGRMQPPFLSCRKGDLSPPLGPSSFIPCPTHQFPPEVLLPRSHLQDLHLCKLLAIFTLLAIEIPKRENLGCGNTSQCRNPHGAPVLGIKHDGRWN